MLLDADGKKKENCCLLFKFVAQSGYVRCVFRLFRLVVSVISLTKLWSLERDHDPWENGLNKVKENGRGWKSRKSKNSESSQRLAGGFLVFHILKMAMCNYISCDRAWKQVCYICTMHVTFEIRLHKQSIRRLVTEIFISHFYSILGGGGL